MNLTKKQINIIKKECEAMQRFADASDNEQEHEYFNGICEGMMKVFNFIEKGRCIE